MEETIQVTTRLSKDVVEKIEEIAKYEKRSRNNVIQLACQEYVLRHIKRKDGKSLIEKENEIQNNFIKLIDKNPEDFFSVISKIAAEIEKGKSEKKKESKFKEDD